MPDLQRMIVDSASLVPPAAMSILGLDPSVDWGALLVILDGTRRTFLTRDGEWIRALTELRDARDITIPSWKFELQFLGWPDDWVKRGG